MSGTRAVYTAADKLCPGPWDPAQQLLGLSGPCLESGFWVAGRPKATAAQLLFMGEAELSKDKHPYGRPAWATPREPAAQQARKALPGGAGPVWGLVPLQD